MRKLIRLIASLLIFLHVFNHAMPMSAGAASSNYGVIIINSNGYSHLYNNLIVISPKGNLMVKADSICKELGLDYSYNKKAKNLTIKNPVNGKSLVFTIESAKFDYYPSGKSDGQSKKAAYKAYYDNKEKSYLIHIGTLKYILGYSYYKDLAGSKYDEMGFKAIAVYNIFDYVSELPVAEQLVDYVNSKTFTSKDELLEAVRLNLLARRTTARFKTNREVMEQIKSSNTIYNLILAIDNKNTAKDADYLSLLIKNFGQRWTSSSKILNHPDGSQEEIKSKNDPATLSIEVIYESTLKEEAIVDAVVNRIVQELNLKNVSDYEKVKLIHDYIINNASYDLTLQRSTAYDLLIEKTAVCEGYALAAYRLFLAAGLESRIITGVAGGGAHAWNIVKLDGKWYNIDITWDDPITNSGRQILRYNYFLKSDKDFTDHERNPEYKTAEFLKAYPIAKNSYQMPKE